jgi:transposase InsO family protein
LNEEERATVLAIANQSEFRNLSPRQIVPLLADQGRYVASESTFYRVLREAGELAHRGHARPTRSRKPNAHIAASPNRVWSWDITYLRSPVRGAFFYLYLVVDIYSRKIVAATVHAEESGALGAKLVESAIAAEGADARKLILHSDNGGPMKASTMLTTLQRLGVIPSFSRPSVSDDNPFAEALFRTLKYRPGYPQRPFESLAVASA